MTVQRLLVQRLLVMVNGALQVAVSSQQVAQQIMRIRLHNIQVHNFNHA